MSSRKKQPIPYLRSTHFLKLVLVFIALFSIAAGGFLTYFAFVSDDVGAYRPLVLLVVITLLPFLFGLMDAYKLLNYIANRMAFSALSVQSLQKIRSCALIISACYILCFPYVYIVAERDDAPGGILIGLILIIAPIIVAVFAAILKELLQSAIEMKSENDLTI